MAITGNPGDLAGGGYGTGNSGNSGSSSSSSSGGGLGNSTREGGFAGAAGATSGGGGGGGGLGGSTREGGFAGAARSGGSGGLGSSTRDGGFASGGIAGLSKSVGGGAYRYSAEAVGLPAATGMMTAVQKAGGLNTFPTKAEVANWKSSLGPISKALDITTPTDSVSWNSPQLQALKGALELASYQAGRPILATDTISGRATSKNHPAGYATDFSLSDPVTGERLQNIYDMDALGRTYGKAYGGVPQNVDPAAFGQYESVAQNVAKNLASVNSPYADSLRWGGYFSPSGTEMDLMHLDFDIKNQGMGGGSFAQGLTPAQERRWNDFALNSVGAAQQQNPAPELSQFAPGAYTAGGYTAPRQTVSAGPTNIVPGNFATPYDPFADEFFTQPQQAPVTDFGTYTRTPEALTPLANAGFGTYNRTPEALTPIASSGTVPLPRPRPEAPLAAVPLPRPRPEMPAPAATPDRVPNLGWKTNLALTGLGLAVPPIGMAHAAYNAANLFDSVMRKFGPGGKSAPAQDTSNTVSADGTRVNNFGPSDTPGGGGGGGGRGDGGGNLRGGGGKQASAATAEAVPTSGLNWDFQSYSGGQPVYQAPLDPYARYAQLFAPAAPVASGVGSLLPTRFVT